MSRVDRDEGRLQLRYAALALAGRLGVEHDDVMDRTGSDREVMILKRVVVAEFRQNLGDPKSPLRIRARARDEVIRRRSRSQSEPVAAIRPFYRPARQSRSRIVTRLQPLDVHPRRLANRAAVAPPPELGGNRVDPALSPLAGHPLGLRFEDIAEDRVQQFMGARVDRNERDSISMSTVERDQTEMVVAIERGDASDGAAAIPLLGNPVRHDGVECGGIESADDGFSSVRPFDAAFPAGSFQSDSASQEVTRAFGPDPLREIAQLARPPLGITIDQHADRHLDPRVGRGGQTRQEELPPVHDNIVV